MWIFTQDGFLSIVQDTQTPGNLLVRARKREDLRRFVQLAQTCLHCRLTVSETPTHDYRFRVTVPHAVAGHVIKELVLDIDYSNFKNRVHDVDPDPRRGVAYTRVWAEMVAFQEDSLPLSQAELKAQKVKVWYGETEVKPRKRKKSRRRGK
jgi:hypothetical protein